MTRNSLCFAAVFATGLAWPHAAPQPAGRTFATAQEAAQALVDAAAQNDTAALLNFSGPPAATSWNPAMPPRTPPAARTSPNWRAPGWW